jgi:hypothetical protein
MSAVGGNSDMNWKSFGALAALRGRLKQFTRISAFDERFGIACVACVKDNCQKRTINN